MDLQGYVGGICMFMVNEVINSQSEAGRSGHSV